MSVVWKVALFLLLQFQTSMASCPGTGTLTQSSGTLSGPSSYQANDRCRWVIMPSGTSAVQITLRDNSLATGDQIVVSQCTTSACTSTTPVKTFSSASWFAMASFSATNPIMLVEFQGGSSGRLSSFTLSYTSTAMVYCAESDCSKHCTASNAGTCSSLSSCTLQNSDPTASVVSCSCVWQYNGKVPDGSSASVQTDYQTNGSCQDLGNAVGAIIAAGFALVGGILVRPQHSLSLGSRSLISFLGRSPSS